MPPTKKEESESEAASPSVTPCPNINIANKPDESSSDDDDGKPIAAVKKGGKKLNKEEVVKAKAKQIVKKEKKVFDLPGQKRDPPEQRDPSRIFYETLYQQVPTSEMAQIWMMECGLLPENVAKQVFEKKQKKVQTLRSPAKTSTSSSVRNISTKSVTTKNEHSSATKNTKSVTVTKEQSSSSANSMKKKKMAESKSASIPSKKRKTADGSDEDGSDDDFEVISKPKKRKLAG